MPSDLKLYHAESAIMLLALWSWVLAALITTLARNRPGLSIARPIFAAFALRAGAGYALSALPGASELRGGDEAGFLVEAHAVSLSPPASAAWIETLTRKVHIWVIAVHDYSFSPPEPALRITMGAIAVAGIALMATAVYELAGAKAARLAAWLVALEPTGIFFSQLLHKEAPMFLAEGLVAFGAASLWRRGHLRYMAPMGAGCLLALATRPYVGWLLIAACGAVLAHSMLRLGPRSPLRGVALAAGLAAVAAFLVPVLERATSTSELARLQHSQDANASDENANLPFERVDYSSTSAIVSNLPQRLRDVSFRPYVWQLGNRSQQLGVMGTLIFIVTFVLFLRYAFTTRGGVLTRAGPMLYVLAFVLVAYALSAGNAGTAFRYRTHILALALCLVVTLRSLSRARATAEVSDREDEALDAAPSQRAPRVAVAS